MDFATLTIEQFAEIDTHSFAVLPLDQYPLDMNSAHNSYPLLLLGGEDPGSISQIDQMSYRHIETRNVEGPTTVVMSSPYSNSEIRYTLNGKNPNPSSHLYTGPITVNRNLSGSDNTAIKARIYSKANANVKSKIIRLEFRVR